MEWRTLCVLGGFALAAMSPDLASADAPAVDHSAFNQLLMENVRDERVDYLNLRKNHLADLGAYLDRMAQVDAEKLPKKEALAYWINVYNATALKAIAERMDADFSVVGGNSAFFKEALVQTKTGRISLDQLENEVLRTKFKEPRIHVGLVCGAVSCPPILPHAYVGATVEKDLEANMKSFVNDQTRNTADETQKTIALSKIFEWYAADFGGPTKVLAYVDRYHPNNLSGYQVTSKEYDWALNFAPPNGVRWIAITAVQCDIYAEPGSGDVVGQAKHSQLFEVLESRSDWSRIRLDSGVMGWVPVEVTEDFAG